MFERMVRFLLEVLFDERHQEDLIAEYLGEIAGKQKGVWAHLHDDFPTVTKRDQPPWWWVPDEIVEVSPGVLKARFQHGHCVSSEFYYTV